MAGAGNCGESDVLRVFRDVEGGEYPFDPPLDVPIPLKEEILSEWEKDLFQRTEENGCDEHS